MIEEIKKPPPPPEVVLPPPPKLEAPPPPFIPPPEIQIATPPPPQPTITATTPTPPPAPVVIAPAPPPVVAAAPGAGAARRPVSAGVVCSNFTDRDGRRRLSARCAAPGHREGRGPDPVHAARRPAKSKNITVISASHQIFARNSVRIVGEYKCQGQGREVTVRCRSATSSSRNLTRRAGPGARRQAVFCESISLKAEPCRTLRSQRVLPRSLCRSPSAP